MNLFGNESQQSLIGGYLYPDTNTIREAYATPEGEDINLDFPWNQGNNYQRFIYTNNGSTAAVVLFTQILKLRKGDVVYLPEYLCSTIIDAVQTTHADIRYYKVDENLNVVQEDFNAHMDRNVRLIYVIHYFGTLQSQASMDFFIQKGQEYHIPVVEDISVSAFSYLPNRIGRAEYLLCGIRKWFPVFDGGFLAIRRNIAHTEVDLDEAVDEVLLQQLLLSMWREGINRSDNKQVNKFIMRQDNKNARRYRELIPREMSEISCQIIKRYPVEQMMRRRSRNYHFLIKELRRKRIPVLFDEMDKGCIPYGVIILIKNRSEVIEQLKSQGFLPQIQWYKPNEFISVSKAATELYNSNLMLQCDQRYGLEQMEGYVSALCNSIY